MGRDPIPPVATGQITHLVSPEIISRQPWIQLVRRLAYLPIGESLEEVGLWLVEGYTNQQYNTTSQYIATRMIYRICEET